MTNQEIKDRAPDDVWDLKPIDATHYSDLDNDVVFYQVTNNILYWDDDYKIWDEVYFELPEIKPL